MRSTEEVLQLAQQQRTRAVCILNRVFLKLPEGIEDQAAVDLIDALVNLVLLQSAAIRIDACHTSTGDKPDEVRGG